MPFEDVSPVRAFRWSKGQGNFPGWWWSATTGRHVGYESWLERDHVMLLDFDPAVVGFASQPFWLSWRGNQRQRRRAPHFFARRADGTGVVIDVRADDRIQPDDAEAFAATERGLALRWAGRSSGSGRRMLCWWPTWRWGRCGPRPASVTPAAATSLSGVGADRGAATRAVGRGRSGAVRRGRAHAGGSRIEHETRWAVTTDQDGLGLCVEDT
ncbi:MAG TPA: TnsA-like heteromeric transposase endonuclease subunit [Actinomycetes bacterium]|nr:TnsA-like heteromeric transposase endonuclease subunit [Actinomycetes bacterium]